MAQSVANANGMAFSDNSRSFTTIGMTATTDNKSAAPSLNTTFGSTNKAWGTNNIWGTGKTFASRVAPRDNSGSRDVSHPNVTTENEIIEGKTGSGSLVESSVCDDLRYKTPWGAKRSLPMSRPAPQAKLPDGPPSQQRSVSTAGLPQTSSTAPHNSASFASRPTTMTLNSPPVKSRSVYAPNFQMGFAGPTYGEPPNVYTKLDRPVDLGARKPRDSGKAGMWPESSPTDGRNAQYGMQFGNRNSLPNSRNGSQPPSRDGDGRSFFHNSGYSRAGQLPSHSASRTPSISSQGNDPYAAYSNSNANQLGHQFNQLSINSNSRPSSSYKASVNSNGSFHNHAPALSGSSTFLPRSAGFPSFSAGDKRVDLNEIRGIGTNTNFNGIDGYASPNQSPRYPDHANVAFNSRSSPRNSLATIGQGHPYLNGNSSAIGYDFVPAQKTTADWQTFGNGMSPPTRNSALAPDQTTPFDPRFSQLFESPIPNHFPPVYDPYAMTNHMGMQTPYSNFMHVNLNGLGSTTEAHVTPAGEDVQSSLLYEFKSNSKPKRYELKHIYDHIAEFSGDQHGSRFIQTKLETANSEEKECVFREIEPNAIPLMTDVFGNYVIQKFFEHGDQKHKKILANKMKGQVLSLSLQMYGCRVVQKALDHVLVDQQAQLIGELEHNVLKCVKDQNGNHVIQKAIERCPSHTIGFIIQAFQGQVQHLGIHPYGCRVIQRCLEHCDPKLKSAIMGELMEGIQSMVSDQYGNYVVQHVVVHDAGFAKQQVLDVVAKGLEAYSKHKFASNVVEKCLEKADNCWRRQVVFSLANGDQRRCEGEGVLVGLIKDNFGNYVVQKLLDTLSAEDYNHFHELLIPAMNQAKRHGCSKQVVSIEKKMHRFPHSRPAAGGGYPYAHHAGSNAYHHHPPPLQTPPFANSSSYGSAATTPPLTTDTQSRQSSAIPSINGDAVEGAALGGRKGSEISAGIEGAGGGVYLR